MRNKTLFLLIACVCGTIAAIGASQYITANSGNSSMEMVEILVATQTIEEQEEITADKLRLEQWPADRVPRGASAKLDAFEGRYARAPVYAGEAVLDMKLMNEKDDVIVPQGYSVVSMPADRDGTVSLVRQGDRVDVRGFFEAGDTFADDTPLIVLSGVKVFGIDGKTKVDPEEKNVRPPKTIQLLIRKADEDAWSFARQYGDISLSLGAPSPEDDNIPLDQSSATAARFLQDLKDYREERERLRLLAKEAENADDGSVVTVAAKPKKNEPVFTQTKMVEGRLVVFAWYEGESVPRVLIDTGAQDSSETPSTTDTSTTTDSESVVDPTGADSPFFAPPTGEQSVEQ